MLHLVGYISEYTYNAWTHECYLKKKKTSQYITCILIFVL